MFFFLFSILSSSFIWINYQAKSFILIFQKYLRFLTNNKSIHFLEYSLAFVGNFIIVYKMGEFFCKCWSFVFEI